MYGDTKIGDWKSVLKEFKQLLLSRVFVLISKFILKRSMLIYYYGVKQQTNTDSPFGTGLHI